MPILDDLKIPLEKIILNSPLHGLLSDDLALISFTDHLTGKRLSFSVEYQKEKRFIRVLCPRKGKCWKKFTYGAPVKILIRGEAHQGWAEIIDDAVESLKEWKTIFKHKPGFSEEFGITLNQNGDAEISELPAELAEIAILRIEISDLR